MNLLKLLCSVRFTKKMVRNIYFPEQKKLATKFCGLTFRNPVGLGAGFDKNALYLKELENLGFGYVEIGTVTPLGQVGNDKPRLFRLPADKALINRMGFNNDGVDIIADRLQKYRATHTNEMLIGGNIGKNKNTPNEEAWKDYETCYIKLYDVVDYFVVNVSSPNTPGLRALQDKDMLHHILSRLIAVRQKQATYKPLLLKIAPDLEQEQVNDIIDLAGTIQLDGLVVNNTTLSRKGLHTSENTVNKIGAGGLSGVPLLQKSTELIEYISQKTKGSIPIIGSGGIETGQDAAARIQAGATLIQVWTGFIYQGPAITRNICQQLALK